MIEMARTGRPKKDEIKKKVLSVRLSDDLYARLLNYTNKNNESMTEVAIRGLEKVLSED